MRKLSKELLEENIQVIVDYDFENKKVFGTCYAVVQGGETLYKKYFGYSSIDKKPLGDNTLFRLASMTESITTIATLILISRGLLSLDDDISKFIPEYKGVHVTKVDGDGIIDLGKAKNIITIRNLLTHSSGIGSSCSDKARFLTKDDKKTAPVQGAV